MVSVAVADVRCDCCFDDGCGCVVNDATNVEEGATADDGVTVTDWKDNVEVEGDALNKIEELVE